MKKFHPYFNENDASTYNIPILKDSELCTLDIDGSLIYIGILY